MLKAIPRMNTPPFTELRDRMLIDIVNMFAGFSGYYGGFSPYLRSIKLIHIDHNEVLEEDIDFYRLFYSYPPFEPIPYPPTRYNDVELYGNRLWFLEVREFCDEKWRFIIRRYLNCLKKRLINASDVNVNLSRGGILFFGKCSELRDEEILLQSIVTFNIVDERNWFLRLRFVSEGGKYFTIYYGLPILRRYLGKLGCHTSVDLSKSLIEKVMRNLGRTRYRPEYLNYITWCYAGRVINTDPLAPSTRCEECETVSSNKYQYLCYNSPGGNTYHYSRKIFPKVITQIKNDLDFRASEPLVPFSIEIFTSRKLKSKVEQFTLSLPCGKSIVLTPTKKPFTVLRKTNGLVVTISERLIRALIHFMERYNIYYNEKLNKSFTLLHLLVAKYFLARKYNPMKVASIITLEVKEVRSKPYISIRKSGNFLERVKRFILNKDYLKDDGFLEFVGLVLVHTLAHVLLLITSEELNLSIDDLAYVYGVKNIESEDGTPLRVFYAAVVERNEMGTLQIDVELSNIFGRDDKKCITALADKLREFWRGLEESQEEYINEYMDISKNVRDLINKDDKALIVLDVSKRIFYELLSNEFLPDSDVLKQIITNVIPSEASKLLRVIRDKLGVDIELRELEDTISRYIDDIVAYLMDRIDMCFDGCNLDIRLDKQCTEALFENIYTSKRLLELFLKVAGIISDSPATLEVNGEGLFNLILASKERLHIQTAFTSTQALYALESILRKGVKVTLEIDRREFGKFVNELKRLSRRYRNFTYKETDVPHHGKYLVVDMISAITSWNYGTSGHPYQNYRASLVRGT